jgi:hypothetical protein
LTLLAGSHAATPDFSWRSLCGAICVPSVFSLPVHGHVPSVFSLPASPRPSRRTRISRPWLSNLSNAPALFPAELSTPSRTPQCISIAPICSPDLLWGSRAGGLHCNGAEANWLMRMPCGACGTAVIHFLCHRFKSSPRSFAARLHSARTSKCSMECLFRWPQSEERGL